MASRLELQMKLEELLESDEVYYQPPKSVSMNYPAIRYKKTKPMILRADDQIYSKRNCYMVTVISRLPDIPVLDKIEALPYCSWNNHYEVDNLHHDIYVLYY